MRLNDISMKRSATALVLLMMVAPVWSAAQVRGGGSDSDWMDYWRRGSEYSTQIQALGDVAVSSIPIPVLLGVELNQLTSNFGDPRGGGTRTHEGLDIMAPAGTPIVSPTDAVVINTGDGPDSGLFVRTANPGGEQFVYMHLKEIGKGIQNGVQVKRDQVLGYVGNTGNASGGAAHLHFEIRKDGAIDPYPRLTQVFTLHERMSAVQEALEKTVDPTGLSVMLAQNFRSTFNAATVQGIAVAQSILNALGSAVGIGLSTAEASTPASYTLTSQANTGVATGGYTRDLEIGMKGEDVRRLQKYLNANGYLVSVGGDGSPGRETTYFGALTQKALITFQKAKGIYPTAGYFGPKTRAYVLSH